MKTQQDWPFLFGAQYYRAPTPDRRYWKEDLRRMADAGFNMVKFWPQWRWIHRGPERFVFDDLDALMDLAAEAGLPVTLNLIYDVTPPWVFRTWPDARMVLADGRVARETARACRQIGGHPGPCYRHPDALDARRRFTRATASRYARHPAMSMWDVWNEAESTITFRIPHPETLTCYCPHCVRAFQDWLRQRYDSLKRLNDRWGRCYETWEEVEPPGSTEVFGDMLDWCAFRNDVLNGEARMRLEDVRAEDAAHPAYLHTVPSTVQGFNPITGVDDFRIAEGCDCFGGTINGYAATLQAKASAGDRVLYNVESHMRFGRTLMPPRPLTVQNLADEFVPQIAAGVRGFLFWQYRAETLGREAPAWGLLDCDGSPGATHAAAAEFWARLKPFAPRLMQCKAPAPDVAVLKSAANESLQWCLHGNREFLFRATDSAVRTLRRQGATPALVDPAGIRSGLDESIRILVLPGVLALDNETADAIVAWVRRGGCLILEGMTGCYELSRGRHADVLPGSGLAAGLGLRTDRLLAITHHPEAIASGGLLDGADADVAKAFAASGRQYRDCLRLTGSGPLAGANALALHHCCGELYGEDLLPLARGPAGETMIAERHVENGTVLPGGGLFTPATWDAVLRHALASVRPERIDRPPARLDRLQSPDGYAVALECFSDADAGSLAIDFSESMVCLFQDAGPYAAGRHRIPLVPGHCRFFVPQRWKA